MMKCDNKNMNEPFWFNEPNILFQFPYIQKLIPDTNDSLSGKLNALTRFIILLSFTTIIFFPERRIKLLITMCITLGSIIIFERHNKIVEKFESLNIQNEGKNVNTEMKTHGTRPTKSNPLMNVLPPEIKYNPKRESAVSSNIAQKEIKDNIKSNLNENLFRDLNDEIDFENFQRKFNVMPNTSIPNAQDSFIKFCYKNTAYDKEKYIQDK